MAEKKKAPAKKEKDEEKHTEHKEPAEPVKEVKETKPAAKEKKKGMPVFYGIAVIVIIAAIAAIVIFALPEFMQPSVTVMPGDNVSVKYAVTVDGKPYDSGNFTYTAAAGDVITGFDENIIGMSVGQKKSFIVSPDKGYGDYDSEAVQPWPLTEDIDANFNITKEQFNESFSEEPVVNKTYSIVALPWDVQVTGIENDTVFMKHIPENNQVIDLPYGTTTITVQGDKIYVKLDPTIGAQFTSIFGPNGYPTIKSVNETHMIIDYNHPLAGKTLFFDVEILGIERPENQSEITTQ